MRVLEIGNLIVEVVKKNIKNIHLAVYPPDGRVRLAAPENVNDDTLRLFTISKLGWIRRQQRKFASQDRQPERKYLQRESHYFLGKRYLLRVIEQDNRVAVVLKNKTYIDLYCKPGETEESLNLQMDEWYRAQLKAVIPNLLDKWQKKIGVEANEWGVRKMKTKWGTCNIEKKKIWFNLELAKKPVQCLEYIIVHELVHLLERLHNVQFESYMNKFMPNWKGLREEMNRLPISHLN